MKDNNEKIYHVINAVQSALSKSGISKDQTNAQQGYKFRGIDDVLNTLSPLLAEHKLLILPRMVSRQCEQYKNAKGNPVFHVLLEAEYDFTAVEDGSLKTIKVFGEAMDSSDKATNKAMSAAYKYAVIQAFAIPIEGEMDADSETHELSVPQQALPTRPAATFKVPPRSPQREETTSGTEVWKGLIDKTTAEPLESKTTGKPYTRYRITMENGDTASTLKENIFAKTKGWDVLHEAAVKVSYNEKYKNWEWIDIEKVETPELPEDWQ